MATLQMIRYEWIWLHQFLRPKVLSSDGFETQVNFSQKRSHFLVYGWATHLKTSSQISSSPPGRDETFEKCFKATTEVFHCVNLHTFHFGVLPSK